MAVVSFKHFAFQMSQPAPYRLMATELKGALNLVLGSLQFLASYYMYSQGPNYNELAERHFDMGFQAVKQGALEFIPGALATYGAAYGAAYAARMYNVTSSDIVNILLSLTNLEEPRSFEADF